jgi:hypothetical protein
MTTKKKRHWLGFYVQNSKTMLNTIREQNEAAAAENPFIFLLVQRVEFFGVEFNYKHNGVGFLLLSCISNFYFDLDLEIKGERKSSDLLFATLFRIPIKYIQQTERNAEFGKNLPKFGQIPQNNSEFVVL